MYSSVIRVFVTFFRCPIQQQQKNKTTASKILVLDALKKEKASKKNKSARKKN